MAKYQVNWVTHQGHNGISEGSELIVKVDNAQYISGGIYQNGFPILALFGMGDTANILLKRKDKSIKGLAVLKIRGHLINMKGFGYDDGFIIF